MTNMDDLIIAFPAETCVMCGAEIPDGKMHCAACEAKVREDERHHGWRQDAYTDACFRLYNGLGSKGWKTEFGDYLTEKELREVWSKAFYYMAEDKPNEFRQSY